MTQEAIAKRRAELLAQRQQEERNRENATRLLDTINGALQDCDFWEQWLTAQPQKPERPALELVRDEAYVEQGA